MNFLASSGLIGYVDLTDSYEIWSKCSLGINAQKVWGFWYLKNFSFWALTWQRSTNLQFADFNIDFLGNQSEDRPPTDWHCAVRLVVRASGKTGNSVQQIVSVLRLKACALTIKSNLKNFYYFWFYILLSLRWCKLFYGYNSNDAYTTEWFFGRHPWRSTVTLSWKKKINILDFKNPNWREADQLVIYKHDRGVELGSTEKQLQL